MADSGFKDPVVLRVRKRHIFGKYPSYQSVANMYLLLAILFPFFLTEKPTGFMGENTIIFLLQFHD